MIIIRLSFVRQSKDFTVSDVEMKALEGAVTQYQTLLGCGSAVEVKELN